jgi:hypothetical protein
MISLFGQVLSNPLMFQVKNRVHNNAVTVDLPKPLKNYVKDWSDPRIVFLDKK